MKKLLLFLPALVLVGAGCSSSDSYDYDYYYDEGYYEDSYYDDYDTSNIPQGYHDVRACNLAAEYCETVEVYISGAYVDQVTTSYSFYPDDSFCDDIGCYFYDDFGDDWYFDF